MKEFLHPQPHRSLFSSRVNDRVYVINSHQSCYGMKEIRVIEILSPGTQDRQRDLSAKRQLYGKYGVKEYWIVDSENREVLVLRLQGQTLEEIATLKSDDELTSPLLSGFQLKVGTIFTL
jgi:Uma2 family endonuclease